MPSSSTTSPTGRRSHSARSAAWPSARAADSGKSNVAIGGSASTSEAGTPPAEMNAARTGLSRCGCGADRADDRLGDLLGARDHRRNEEDDHRVDPGIGEHVGDRLLVGRADRGAEHVDRVREARLARQHGRELLAASPRRAAGARARRRRRRRRRGSPARPRSSARRPGGRAATAGGRAAPRRRRAPRASRRGSRLPAGTARRPRSSSRRAQRCASRRRAGPRSSGRPSSPGSASSARRGGRRAANLRGLPNDSR